MALLLTLSYLSFGCNWKQLSATEAVAGIVSPYHFFCFVFDLMELCFFDFNKILLVNSFLVPSNMTGKIELILSLLGWNSSVWASCLELWIFKAASRAGREEGNYDGVHSVEL